MPDYQPANEYTFDDDKGVTARLDVSPQTGKPTATLSVDGREASRVKVKAQGSRHTVEGVLSQMADGDGVVVTLLVPVVQLATRGVPATAVLLVTTRRGSLAGPGAIKGALETIEAREVTGRARIVQSLGGRRA